jgi:hypothetical protein
MAMLASITVTPGNGLVANKYMPVTNPVSPARPLPRGHRASSSSCGFSLRVRAHRIAGGGRSERWHQGISGILPRPRVPTLRADQLVAARNHGVSACCARVSLLLLLGIGAAKGVDHAERDGILAADSGSWCRPAQEGPRVGHIPAAFQASDKLARNRAL